MTIVGHTRLRLHFQPELTVLVTLRELQMSHIDVAERGHRHVRGVAGANQGRPHRVATFLAWRIATDCGFDLSDPCEIKKATARRHASRRLPSAASRVTDSRWVGARYREHDRGLAAASAREDPLEAAAARWRLRRAVIRAACTGERRTG
jgi:hypothetical protein